MDKLLDTLNQYLGAAQSVLSKYGPQVWDATLSLVRLNAVFDLLSLAIFTGVCLYGVSRVRRFAQAQIAKEHSTYDSPELWYLLLMLPGSGLIVCVVSWLCSFPSWLALFDPRLAVLYKIAAKAGLL